MTRRTLAVSLLLLASAAARGADDPASWVPTLVPLESTAPSELRDVVSRFTSDHDALVRRFDAPASPDRRAAMRGFTQAWQTRLATIDYDALSAEGRIDWLLLSTRLTHELRLMDREEKRLSEMAPLTPFADPLLALSDARRRMASVDPKAAAKTLADATRDVEKTQKAIEAGLPDDAKGGKAAAAPVKDAVAPIHASRIVAYRSAARVKQIRETLGKWYRFYDGYDPLFSWWCAAPYKKTDAALEKYAKFLREKVVGIKEGDDEPIVGDPIGRDAILEDLRDEIIPYTPEQLVVIAEREFAWCESGDEEGVPRDGLRRRLEEGAREGQDRDTSSRASSPSSSATSPRSRRLPREARPRDDPAARRTSCGGWR